MLACTIAFTGAWIILRPDFFKSLFSSENEDGQSAAFNEISIFGLVMTAMHVFMISVNRLYINYISDFVSPLNNTFYVNIAVLFMASFFGILDSRSIAWPEFTQSNIKVYCILLVNGVSSFLV